MLNTSAFFSFVCLFCFVFAERTVAEEPGTRGPPSDLPDERVRPQLTDIADPGSR